MLPIAFQTVTLPVSSRQMLSDQMQIFCNACEGAIEQYNRIDLQDPNFLTVLQSMSNIIHPLRIRHGSIMHVYDAMIPRFFRELYTIFPSTMFIRDVASFMGLLPPEYFDLWASLDGPAHRESGPVQRARDLRHAARQLLAISLLVNSNTLPSSSPTPRATRPARRIRRDTPGAVPAGPTTSVYPGSDTSASPSPSINEAMIAEQQAEPSTEDIIQQSAQSSRGEVFVSQTVASESAPSTTGATTGNSDETVHSSIPNDAQQTVTEGNMTSSGSIPTD
ncbi:hypothetical protein BT63DRAFT_463425 [Microthyrium microscopicum]|uniref:Uncharacterized protein n=1 Tax=Microthyrium microscopicum TaxID=703497 RepID=A0A6A6U5U5_9PEZI|nr:hypothetical protein BT63DRAFT_463425 [Microthyrium microscopicum]